MAPSSPTPLCSMTGFARSEGAYGSWRWVWELKSVNNRGLDVRVRLPGGADALDATVRKRLGECCRRGSLHVGLQMSREEGAGPVRVNEAALEQVLTALDTVRARVDTAAPSAEGILALRGVLDVQDTQDSDEDRTARDAAVLASFETALEALVDARTREGAALNDVLTGHLDQITSLLAEAEALSALQPDKLRKRLSDQLSVLMESAAAGLGEERVAQEAALLMTKADVREELDRLKAHVDGARELLTKGGAVGRRFDFLTQEFNREANTLCSKSPDIALTRVGLDLKAVIDQMREQVQNVE